MIAINNLFLLLLFYPLFVGSFMLMLNNRVGLYYINTIFNMTNLFNIIVISYSFLNLFYHELVAVSVIINVISIFNYNINLDIWLDTKLHIMVFVVIIITYFVTLFSFWYMKGDPNFLKFLAFLNFFSFFMLILVLSNNMFILFLGWEGIGLFSYFLINFWSTRLNANRSALKAVIFNKVGDIFLYGFMTAYFLVFNSLTIVSNSNLISSFKFDEFLFETNYKFITVLTICLLFSAVAKSAQIILHVWLPDAMEGPTPVSALLHAATMVTAGIFVLIKFNWVIAPNNEIYAFIVLIGILTNLLASFVAIFQYDIKKIVAYSTASQLGLIFVAFGTKQTALAYFHIYNHSFFKALSFILCGILIHKLLSIQDLRCMTGLKVTLYFVYSAFIVSLFTLGGFPYLASFYSKEFVIQGVFANVFFCQITSLYFLFLSVLTTVSYSLRLMNFLFFNKIVSNFDLECMREDYPNYVYVDPNFLKFVVYLLALASIFSGHLMQHYFHFDTFFINTISFYDFDLEGNALKPWLQISPITILFALLLAQPVISYCYFFVLFNLQFTDYKNVIYFFVKKTYFDNFYYYTSKLTQVALTSFSFVVDKLMIEGFLILFVDFIKYFFFKFTTFYESLPMWFHTILIVQIILNAAFAFCYPYAFFFGAIGFIIGFSILKTYKFLFKKNVSKK